MGRVPVLSVLIVALETEKQLFAQLINSGITYYKEGWDGMALSITSWLL